MTVVVVDTSALASVVFGEADAASVLADLTDHAGDLVMSAVTRVEAGIVVESRQGPAATADLELLVSRLGVTVAAVDDAQVAIALAGWRRFGKGRHVAALNLGDCFAYALAKALGAELLFKGEDFDHTDVAALR